eukprot:scaffold67643_cov58-Phaeocystis_antarctica.AAC.2
MDEALIGHMLEDHALIEHQPARRGNPGFRKPSQANLEHLFVRRRQPLSRRGGVLHGRRDLDRLY